MTKVSLISLAVCAIASTAVADESTAFPGDADFLADAYEAAESGTDFSYARQWGAGRAYDGNDTSNYYAQLVEETTAQNTQSQARSPRSNLITRAAASPQRITRPRPSLRGRLAD